jgi:gp16 family phage-associated protein
MSRRSAANVTNVTATKQASLTADEVKTRLREQGTTLKQWAQERNYPYATVSMVVRGVNRGTFGMGHRIAVELGLKRG